MSHDQLQSRVNRLRQLNALLTELSEARRLGVRPKIFARRLTALRSVISEEHYMIEAVNRSRQQTGVCPPVPVEWEPER